MRGEGGDGGQAEGNTEGGCGLSDLEAKMEALNESRQVWTTKG
jgi:hypothetical protein